ncbi:hypothetical protein C0992_006631 [Termitomyces sp. T32_za158]|nr:hypothetical protein C0992_006631 [Termitomyces sp. T32_za158]
MSCRIPPELLSAIFSEVAHENRKIGHKDWIKSITHVCSHWREVALNDPKLWANISLENAPWAEEMLRRSDPEFLTIRYDGPMKATKHARCTRSLKILSEILRLHLPRIKSLVLDSCTDFGLFLRPDSTASESIDILSLLNQPAPMMERLEVRLFKETKNSMLPCDLFAMSSRLRHLTLENCGMAWDPELINFENLRSLTLSKLPRVANSSLHQILDILRHAPYLESLNLENRDEETGPGDSSLLPGIDPVPLRHLERIKLTGGLSYCVLLNHIVFSQNACSIDLSIRNLSKISRPLAQALADGFDSGIEGSTRSLSIRQSSILYWKSKDTTDVASFRDPPTTSIGGTTRFFNTDLFWKVARLNQLVSLRVSIILEQDSWAFFEDLPQLRDIWVSPFQYTFVDALHHGLVEESTADAQPLHMTFPALRNLTITVVPSRYDPVVPFFSLAQSMLACFELRKKAGLRLDRLRLKKCPEVDDLQLQHLRGVIGQVQYTLRDD